MDDWPLKLFFYFQDKSKDYEYVMDEEIEFVQALQMPGTKEKEKDAGMSEADKKKMSIQECRRSLPVSGN